MASDEDARTEQLKIIRDMVLPIVSLLTMIATAAIAWSARTNSAAVADAQPGIAATAKTAVKIAQASSAKQEAKQGQLETKIDAVLTGTDANLKSLKANLTKEEEDMDEAHRAIANAEKHVAEVKAP